MAGGEAQLGKSRWMAYGALVTAIAGGIAVILTALADYKMASNPRARPDSFTPTDFAAGVAPIKQQVALLSQQLMECRRDTTNNIDLLRQQITELKTVDKEFISWRRDHLEWGNLQLRETERWRGGIDADHKEFHRLLRGKQ